MTDQGACRRSPGRGALGAYRLGIEQGAEELRGAVDPQPSRTSRTVNPGSSETVRFRRFQKFDTSSRLRYMTARGGGNLTVSISRRVRRSSLAAKLQNRPKRGWPIREKDLLD